MESASNRVTAAKVDGGWYLHELTEGMGLELFVLFSSMAGVFGGPGQGGYAAGNAFLDALAAYRRGRGLAGVSLAWGLWGGVGMGRGLGELDMRRMAGSGAFGVVSGEQGLELLEPALATGRALVVPVPFDRGVLRREARAGEVPGLLQGLAGVVRAGAPHAHARASGSLAARLAGLDEGERLRVVLDAVRGLAAGVLGHSSPDAVDPDAVFRDLGFDSLAAVELRNRLAASAGLRLAATVVFDHPTVRELADYVLGELVEAGLLRSEGRGVRARGVAVAPRARVVDEPVVVVGMSCRFPGGVRSPQELWELVAAGGEGIGEFPGDRGWDLGGLYNPDPDHPGTSYTRHGGFLYDAGEFDPAFFGIGPREALAIDPQHRLLLQASWEAIENAHIDPRALKGTETGVFTGVMYHEYGAQLASMPKGLEGYLGTGGSVASGRVAYSFGLQGPAVTVDTACSSSLVALHLASQSLRQGELTLALAGGVTVLATPEMFIRFSRQRALSPDGRCRAFAQAADGTAWSEGVGVLLLERLSDAQRQGHPILAVIRGSAINQDGASNGLTAPNGPSQQRVITQALANAGLSPHEIDAVEAHGTGTALGDPIEAQALIATYGPERPPDKPLWLGSVKSNIGHTQAAAGVAGVIKTIMALHHETLPRTLHAHEPSEHIDWDTSGLSLLTHQMPWTANEHPRRAAVSSFGISGTNAHIILEEPPATEPTPLQPDNEPATAVDGAAVVPWVLSGRGEKGLQAQASRLRELVVGDPALAAEDVGLSLAARPALERRAAILGCDRDELLEGLGALARRDLGRCVLEGVVDGGGTAFLFTGQGAQRVGMGRELYRAYPVFTQAFDEVCQHMDGSLGGSLRAVVFGDQESAAGSLDDTLFTQTGLFALEVALFRLVRDWGVRPGFLIGHSIGEIVAAHVAGVFSLQDACTLVAARGRLMGALPAGGAMVSVAAPELEVLAVLGELGDRCKRVSIAAVNGPSSVVVSGDEDVALEVAGVFEGKGVRTKRLRVSHAFHSPRMDGMLEEFRELLEDLSFAEPQIPIVSNLTGEPHSTETVCSPDYWVRHVRETVRFHDGARHLRAHGVTSYLELGPSGVLSAMVEDAGVSAVPVLRGERAEAESLLAALASAWVRGGDVDWERAFAGSGAQRVALPSYAFQRERFWLQPRTGAGDVTAAGLATVDHPLVGACVQLAGEGGWLFTGRLSLDSHEWLSDHMVLGTVLLPGTAFVELALHAGRETGCPVVGELVLEAPLALGEHDGVRLQVSVGEPDESGSRPVAHSLLPGGRPGGPARRGARVDTPRARHARAGRG